MKFRVDRDVLADAVAWAARSLPVRPSVPVLSGLLIDASDDGLVLSTFDYETSARATLSAEVSDEGRALVSGRLLSDICRSLPAKPVEMVLDGSRVSLTCGSARFSLQTMPVEDYPALPDMPAATGTVSSDVFAHAVQQAVTAAGRDDMLPVLTGVRIEISGSSISMLATDRFRRLHVPFAAPRVHDLNEDGVAAWLDVRAAFGRLSAKERAALVSTTLLGLTPDEAGDALGMTSGAVRSAVSRAREKLETER